MPGYAVRTEQQAIGCFQSVLAIKSAPPRSSADEVVCPSKRAIPCVCQPLNWLRPPRAAATQQLTTWLRHRRANQARAGQMTCR